MRGMAKGTKIHKWTEEELTYLKQITPGRSHKEILYLMNSKFGCELRLKQVTGAIKRFKLKTGLTGRFEKGHIPANKGTKGLSKSNKTSYQEGHIPGNYRPVGAERVSVDGYTEIKVKDPNKWKLKHRVVWEQHYGEIQQGSVVIFADGDKSNVAIENLILVTRNQLLTLNSNRLIKHDAELTKIGVNIANLIIKTAEVKKRK